jgi:membrane protease YdiL (CAAX protease family)
VTTKTRVIRIGIMLLGVVALLAVLSVVQIPMRAAHLDKPVAWVILMAVALGFYLAWQRFVERRRPDELAPNRLLPEISLGLAIGIALFALTIALIAAAGAYYLAGFNGWSPLARGLLFAVAIGMFEEIVFRGFLFRVVRDVGNTWIALAVSTAVFGAAHAFNPGATLLSTVAVALEAGLLLGLAYAVTNRLWLPIGLHAGWNFAEGTIFGTQVSGNDAMPAMLNGMLKGPAALTGGSFGPEASYVALVVCLAASVALAVVVVRRERASRSVVSYRALRSTGT